MNYTNELTIDWLTLTWRPDLSKVDMQGFNGLTDYFFYTFPWIKSNGVVYCSVKKLHYEFSYIIADGFDVFIDEKEDGKGVCFSMSSKGLETFYKLSGIDTIKKLFDFILDYNFGISRIDLAFDDYSKTYYPVQYFDWFKNGQMCTRMSAMSYWESSHGHGQTFYLGRRGENKMVRIYDKEIESDGDKACIRYEFELHRDGAKSILRTYKESGMLFSFTELLYSCFRIQKVGYSEKTDKSDRATLPEWEEWLKTQVSRIDVEKKLDCKKTKSSFEKKEWWLKNQVSKTLALIYSLSGPDVIEDMLNQGMSSFTDRDKLLLNQEIKYRLENNLI